MLLRGFLAVVFIVIFAIPDVFLCYSIISNFEIIFVNFLLVNASDIVIVLASFFAMAAPSLNLPNSI
jgi:hypothetical protein